MLFYAIVLLFAYVVAATLLLLHIAQIKQKVAWAVVLSWLQSAVLIHPCTHSLVHGAFAVLAHTRGRLVGLLGDARVLHPCQHRPGRSALCVRSSKRMERIQSPHSLRRATADSASELLLDVPMPAHCHGTDQH